MSRLSQDPKALFGLAGLGVGVVLIGSGTLAWLATPKTADARLAAAATTLKSSSRVIAGAGDLARYPAHGVCEDAGRGGDALRTELARAASAAKVTLGDVRLERSAAPEQMLATLTLDLSAKGEEQPLKTFLGGLSKTSPLLIVDGLDLSSDGKETTLQLKARALCHERRLP